MSATSVGEEGRDLIRWARSIKDIGFHIHPIPNGKVTSRITSLIGNCKEKKKDNQSLCWACGLKAGLGSLGQEQAQEANKNDNASLSYQRALPSTKKPNVPI